MLYAVSRSFDFRNHQRKAFGSLPWGLVEVLRMLGSHREPGAQLGYSDKIPKHGTSVLKAASL